MSFFQDREYEDMDWLNLAVEEPTFTLNDVLVTLPDSIEITPKMIEDSEHNELSVKGIITPYFPEVELSRREKECLMSAYKWNLSESTVEVYFNFETGELSEPIHLVKAITFFEGEQLTETVVNLCMDIISETLTNKGRIEGTRINEICDFLSANNKIRSTRSVNKKIRYFAQEFKSVIREDKWKIRNMDLLIKSVTWACEYILTGNLAALTNFNKLKVMTHKKQPIYSMEETV